MFGLKYLGTAYSKYDITFSLNLKYSAQSKFELWGLYSPTNKIPPGTQSAVLVHPGLWSAAADLTSYW